MYGMSTIFGRLLNYALVPFYTYIFGTPADFGLNTEFYAYISFLNIIFTYGMETALFNFSTSELNKERVYSTAVLSLLVSSLVLTIPFLVFANPIADVLRYPGHSSFIVWAILIVLTDALAAIPFAKLREQNRAKRFASIKLINIAVNLAVNFFFIGWCKWAHENQPGSWAGSLYDPEIGIGYAFLANLIANLVSLLFLLPQYRHVWGGFDRALFRRMLAYALPLLVVGLAGMTNETMDRILLKYLVPAGTGETQVGSYGACYKISILMTIFIQAFRYSAEPFFFAQRKEADARETNAKVMTFFVAFCLIIFLGTTLNLSWIQYFVGENFRVGLPVVPILLLANLFLGVYFNLSIWYKLTGRTRFGMWLTLIGAIITLTLNFFWIPSSGYFGGYMGSSWATLICYAIMMVLSYWMGQKHYPIPYRLPRMFAYLGLALLFYFIAVLLPDFSTAVTLTINNVLLLVFIGIIIAVEKPQQLLRKTPKKPSESANQLPS
ncbi:MAG: lipopolysaccharide biosynthesis protein [Bacteroidia bacterium]